MYTFKQTVFILVNSFYSNLKPQSSLLKNTLLPYVTAKREINVFWVHWSVN